VDARVRALELMRTCMPEWTEMSLHQHTMVLRTGCVWVCEWVDVCGRVCVWGRNIHNTHGSVKHTYTDTQSHETHFYNTQTLRSLGLHGVWGVHQNLGRQVYEVHYGYPGYTGGGGDGGG
jgi:hypothetical protein